MTKKRIFTILTILLMLFTSVITLGNSYSTSKAGPLCGATGSFMSINKVYSPNTNGNKPNRKWTADEVFGVSTWFTSYYGEGESDWIYANKVDRGKNRAELKGFDWNDADVQDNLKSARSLSCVVGNGDFIPNSILAIATIISTVTGFFISALLGEDFMVAGLVKIIGGTNNNDGLITIFFNSIYMPLVVIAFLFAAVTIVYKGLIKRQLREALSSIIWSTMAFVIGVTLMFIPQLLVGIPQAVTSTITTCVLGALNGENCLTGAVTTPSLLTGIECSSKVDGNGNNSDMMVNGMNCTIWKTFVLEPWAEEQFGTPYSQLYTYNPPEGGSIWNGLADSGMDGKDYCVNLASSRASDDFAGETVVMDRNSNSSVCNIALYQLYLSTDMKDTVNHNGDSYTLTSNDGSSKDYDERWYDIIVPMAKHNSGWNNWTGQNRLIMRIGSTLMGIFGIFASSIVLVVLSVFAAAYKVTGVIMMAFAPLFLLFAIEPNRGKKIFLGWLETLISSLLKYFAITILTIVSLVLYSGILATTSNITSFISVIILTVVLLNYRSEVVNLIGASNMGGQRLTNKANKALDWTKKQAEQKGSALAGGAIGGAVAGRNSYLKDIEERKLNIAEMQKSIDEATAENRHEDAAIIESAMAEEKKITEELETDDSRKAAMRKGSFEGAKGAGNRIMRRGVSLTASAFREQKMTQSALDKAYSDKRGKDIHNDPEVLAAMSGKNENNSNDGEGSNQENDFKMSDLDLNKTTLESQRDKLEYTGDLTEQEKSALDKFADNLANQADDSKLANMSNNPEIMNDPNKQMAVANEINARLRFNTLTNKVTNPDLSMNPMVNPANMSNIDLKMGMEIAEENYKASGNINEFNRLNELGQEEIDRGIRKEETFEKEKELLKDFRGTLEKENIDYPKNDSKKSKEELSKMYKEDKESYNKHIEDNYSEPVKDGAGESVSVSQSLINREKKVGDIRDGKKNNNKKTQDSKLPGLDDLDDPDDHDPKGPGGNNTNSRQENNVNPGQQNNSNPGQQNNSNPGQQREKEVVAPDNKNLSQENNKYNQNKNNDNSRKDSDKGNNPKSGDSNKENIDKTKQSPPEEFSWEDTFEPGDINNSDIESLNNQVNLNENEIDDFYDNLDDFIK